MLYLAISILSLAAIVGMLLLSYVLKTKETPKGVVFTHGPLALIGVVLLLIYSIRSESGPIESLVLFGIAAISGFVLVARDLLRMSLPKWLAVSHGLIAISGFIFLLIYAFHK